MTKQVCFLSGKGGTGKTSICAACASLEGETVLVDADVESSNLPLLIRHTILHTEPFSGRKCAAIDTIACTRCRKCLDLCAYGAIYEDKSGDFAVVPDRCEGCTLCERLCPSLTITTKESTGGEWYVSKSAFGPLIHASLALSEESSGKLIRVLRMMAESIAREGDYDTILIDGPAGLGCPVISSITGADAVVIVTEPTAAGLSDLRRILELTGHFTIPTCLCINKSTIDREVTQEIEQLCEKRGICRVGDIPFDDAFREALNKGMTIMEYDRGALKERLTTLWRNIQHFVDGNWECLS